MRLSYIHEAQQPQWDDLGHRNDVIECELCGMYRYQKEFHKPVPCEGCGQLMQNDTEGCSICAGNGGLCSDCWDERVRESLRHRSFQSNQSKELPENPLDDTEDECVDMNTIDVINDCNRRAGFHKLLKKYES
jgi:hypothetical protein